MRTLLLGCVGLLMAAGGARAAAPEAGIEAVTKPSADVTLSFSRPGRVAEVRVREGDTVKPDDLLVRLDDEAERIEVDQLKAQADDLIRIKAAEAQVVQKKEDLKKLEWAGKEGAATQWEIEHARLEVVIGELSTDLARFNQRQDRYKYEVAKAQLDRMRLPSPVAGKVEEVMVEVGEAADPNTKVIRVVKTDVLWADVPVPLAVGRTLVAGQMAQVEFPQSDGKGVDGKVLYAAAVADAASETLIVRVEISNPSGRPAGERVRVRFPAPAAGSK